MQGVYSSLSEQAIKGSRHSFRSLESVHWSLNTAKMPRKSSMLCDRDVAGGERVNKAYKVRGGCENGLSSPDLRDVSKFICYLMRSAIVRKRDCGEKETC